MHGSTKTSYTHTPCSHTLALSTRAVQVLATILALHLVISSISAHGTPTRLQLDIVVLLFLAFSLMFILAVFLLSFYLAGADMVAPQLWKMTFKVRRARRPLTFSRWFINYVRFLLFAPAPYAPEHDEEDLHLDRGEDSRVESALLHRLASYLDTACDNRSVVNDSLRPRDPCFAATVHALAPQVLRVPLI